MSMEKIAGQMKLIYVVDDEPVVRKAIVQSLTMLPCAVSSFPQAEDCLQELRRKACDLLITDLNMPGMSGMDLLSAVKEHWPYVPVLVVSGFGDIPTAMAAVRLGAIDFLEKPLDETTLLPKVTKALAESSVSLVSNNPITEAERRVLELMAEGKTNKEIAGELDRSVRTVENHRQRLMRKLGAATAADLIKIALKAGLLDRKT